MPSTSTSPFAPAHIRVLLLPVGKIRRSRFQSFIERLRPERVVRLGDISPDPNPEKATFSSIGFPNGSILYNLSTALPPASHSQLAAFESFRSPLLVLCIVDAREYIREDGAEPSWEEIGGEMEKISERFRQPILLQVLIFDYPQSPNSPTPLLGSMTVPSSKDSKSTTIKTVMCDVSAKLLAEMCSLASSIQALESIESPGRDTIERIAPQAKRSLDIFRNVSSNVSSPELPMRTDNGSKAQNSRKDVSDRDSLQVAKTARSVSRPSSAAGGVYTQPSAAWPEELPTERTQRSFSNASSSTRPGSPSGTPTKDRKSKILNKSNTHIERGRSRLKARQALLIGTLFLQAGRWPDALRELVDATTRARAFSDHVWFAKGLENILVTMLLLVYSGVDFQIPSICYPVSEKSYNRQSMMTNINGVIEFRTSDDTSHSRTLENLSSLLPDLIHMISNAYTRAEASDSEPLPQLCFSQSIIRLANLLSSLQRNKHSLTDNLLKSLISDTIVPSCKHAHSRVVVGTVSKKEISSLIFRAFPNRDVDVTTTDMIIILSDMASVLSDSGLQRKSAIVCKELLTLLVPALIQARKMGAAEVGIHPAASLAVIQNFDSDPSSLGIIDTDTVDIRIGFRGLLLKICRSFGINTSAFESLPDVEGHGTVFFKSDDESKLQINNVHAQMMRALVDANFGGLSLKSETLRLCTNFSEALPDFVSVSKFNSMILRTIGPSAALKKEMVPGAVMLPRDEQIRLVSKIGRSLNMGLHKPMRSNEPDYWDDFLLRDVSLSRIEPESSSVSYFQVEEKRGRTSAVATDGPFLHKAFQRSDAHDLSSGILVAGEPVDFLITLQNPYDFDVHIEKLLLVSGGIELVQTSRPFAVPASRVHKILVLATPVCAGPLRIIGCNIKVRGCQQRLFLLFPLPWKHKPDEKIKRNGLQASVHSQSRPNSLASAVTDNFEISREVQTPQNSIVFFFVANPQPMLEVVCTSLSQSILGLAEGETHSFTITVRNISQSVPANFFHLSFEILAPGFSKEENEYFKDCLRWSRYGAGDFDPVQPGATATFETHVFGKLGITEILVQINYTKLEAPLDEIKGKFYARRLDLQLAVTVIPSVQLQRVDMIPLPNGTTGAGDANSDASRFLLLLDVRNFWSKPLTVALIETQASTDENNSALLKKNSTENVIQPGHVSRLAFPLPRLLVQDASKALPQNESRQFVLRQSDVEKDTPETREAFWYHQALLEQVTGSWKETHGERTGILSLRSIRLTPRNLDVIRRDKMNVRLSVQQQQRQQQQQLQLEGENIDENTGKTFGRRAERNGPALGTQPFSAQCSEFLTVTTTIRNDSSRALRPFVRLYPRLKDYVAGMDFDPKKNILWTGLLHQPGPLVPPGSVFEFETEILFLAAGSYEIGVVVHEIRVAAGQKAPNLPLGKDRFVIHIKN